MGVVAFNCNKIKHTYWPFVFKDKTDEEGNKIPGKKIMVRMPTKGTFEKMQDFQDITNQEEDTQAAGAIEVLHDLIAEILNNNLENINPKKPKHPVRAKDLEEYDIEECVAILNAYGEFVDELRTDPN